MNLKGYLSRVSISDVAFALEEFYPHLDSIDVAAHIGIIPILLHTEPADTDLEEFYVEVHYVPASSNHPGQWYVSGKYPPGTKGFEQYDGYWAVDMMPWAEVLALPIVEKVDPGQHLLTKSEVVALFLHEITFYGFSDEEIQKKREELNRAVEDIDLDDLIDHDEFLRSLEEEDDEDLLAGV